MKFTKHQKEIIRKINGGEIHDIFSYLESFDMLYNFKIDKTLIEEKFVAEEGEKTYEVLKSGASATYKCIGENPLRINASPSQLKEVDFEYKPAKLVFDKIKSVISYKEKTYEFDPCDNKGINIAVSFDKIKEFITIWSYLHSELYVLEVPKAVRKEELGLFLERKSNKEVKKISDITEKLKNNLLKSWGIEETKNRLLETLVWRQNPPEVDAYKYADEVLELNKDNFIVCDYYLDKKILCTPELELFIKNRFKTTEQLHFYWALLPAYLAVFASIVMPLFLQKQRDIEVIEIQNQLSEIRQEVLQLETTNSHLQNFINGLDNIKIEQFDDSELKEILLEIIEVIESK